MGKSPEELKRDDHIIDIVGEIIDGEIDAGIAMHRINNIITQQRQEAVDDILDMLNNYEASSDESKQYWLNANRGHYTAQQYTGRIEAIQAVRDFICKPKPIE